MLRAAEEQLATSVDHDFATRAVCEAAGVTQPVLYRLFGDKRGLLDALADSGLDRYAALKAAQGETDDPLVDLRAGWDQHMEFAKQHPGLYQLMFVPRPWSHSTARQRVFDLLVATLDRCAAVGAITVEPRVAAQLILSANVGVALNQIAQPALFTDPTLSHRMRNSVFGYLTVEAATFDHDTPLQAAAVRLRAQLGLSDTAPLDPAESALLQSWLHRIIAAQA